MLSRKPENNGEAKTRVFNATLERIREQVNSRVFVWEPNSACEVPDELIKTPKVQKFFSQGHGMFICYDNDEDFDFEKERRAALTKYIREGGLLHRQIRDFNKRKEEDIKRGMTWVDPPRFVQLKKWYEDLKEMLGHEEKIEGYTSFKDLSVPKVKKPVKSKKEDYIPMEGEG